MLCWHYGVWGLGLRVWCLRFRVVIPWDYDLGLGVDLGFRVVEGSGQSTIQGTISQRFLSQFVA